MDFLDKYGIKINDQELLLKALTHSSYAYENNTEDYERLEFLGDAVLQFLISEYFYSTDTDLNEGQLSKKRASYVCEEALASYVRDAGYDNLIRVGNGLSGSINEAIIADTFESVLAVIYLDNGIDKAREYVHSVVIPYIKKNHVFLYDYKTKLQELVQTDKKSLEYVLVNSYGEAHNMTFEVNVMVDGIILGKGIGRSKKEAEQKAAKEAINKSVR